MRWLFALFVLLALPFRADALTAADQAEVERLRDYLNRMITLEARFVQLNEDGAMASGRLWLHRPRRLRFEYDPPTPILIVANRTLLAYHDKSLNQTSYMNQRETPAWFLLAEEVQLGDDVIVHAVGREGPLVTVTAEQRGRQDDGRITLIFNHSPIELRGWRMVDSSGNRVRVDLVDQKLGVPIDPNLFEFRPPDREEDFGR